jgi:hypothetical protein
MDNVMGQRIVSTVVSCFSFISSILLNLDLLFTKNYTILIKKSIFDE